MAAALFNGRAAMADEIKGPAEHFAQTGNLVTGWLADGEVATSVTAALRRYGTDRRRKLVGAVSGADAATYVLSAAGLASWADGATVYEVAYPYTAADPSIMHFDQWTVEEDPTDGDTLVFPDHTPAAGEVIRIRYSAAWDEASIPTAHITAVSKLAAANILRCLAARLLQAGDASMNIDSMNSAQSSQEAARLASSYESQYEETIGKSSGDTGGSGDGSPVVGAAMSVFSIDAASGHGLGKLVPYPDED